MSCTKDHGNNRCKNLFVCAQGYDDKKKWCGYIHERIKEAQGQNCASIVHLDLLIICNRRSLAVFGLKLLHGKLTISCWKNIFQLLAWKLVKCEKLRNVENSGHWKGNIKLRIKKSLKIMNCDKCGNFLKSKT